MREILLSLTLVLMALGLFVASGGDHWMGLGPGFALRLLPVAGGLLLAMAAVRIIFGKRAQIDEAVLGTGAYQSAPNQVRAAAIVGAALIVAAIVLAAGRIV